MSLDGVPTDGTTPVRGLSRRLHDAVRHLEEHATSAVTIADAAAAAGLSVRGLQKAFRTELSTTPGAFLRGVRLEGVRRDLRSAGSDSPRTTVAEVARRWRFSNAGRMAAEYRAVYGTSPSTALRYFDGPPADDPPAGPDVDADRRRFRLVLDCEVTVDDLPAALASAVRAPDATAWNGYRPGGSAEDLVAYVLGTAVRSASEATDGLRLMAVNPSVRVPDDEGAYDAVELPAWQGVPRAHRARKPDPEESAPPGRATAPDCVESEASRESAHG